MEKEIRKIIEFIGDDPEREGLIETPKRVIKSWQKLFGGYNQDPKDIMKTFTEDACDEMVVLKNIEFYSTCEHHMIPFFGKIHIGYIPNGKVLGISKLARLVEIYARRLQIQEKLVSQIAEVIMTFLNPKGVIVIAEAQHLCMLARGVEKQNSIMITSAIRGVFKEVETRNEFMNLIH
jgi:GTP cyclohydrolase IA